MGKRIDCNFNLFKEGRTYTGHHRSYILESAHGTCYNPATRELIQQREALGYLGHGRRQLAGKLPIGEVEAIKLPDGSSILVENIPSNVTVSFEVGKDGEVRHTQEILESAPGLVVASLNASRVGGFSWACGGFDGGAGGAKTKVTSFHGFDYVMQPGFSANRGYILESAGDTGLILENVVRMTGLDNEAAEKWLRQWSYSAILENADLRETVDAAEAEVDAAREALAGGARLLESANNEISALKASEGKRQQLIMEAARRSVVVVPASILDAMLHMTGPEDFAKLVGFFENAGKIPLSTLPLGGKRVPVSITGVQTARMPPEYGSAAHGEALADQFV